MATKTQKQIRIIDIAKKANVSIGTVDRVLYNRGGVHPETQKKVEEIIAELNYSPNMLAKSLALKKAYKVVVFIPSYRHNAYWKKPYAGIKQALSDMKNFNLVIETVTFDLSDEDSFKKKTRTVLNKKPSGVVLNPVFKESALEFCRQLDDANIPYSFMDIDLKGTNNLAYFGQDAKKSGMVTGKLMLYSVPKDGEIAIIKMSDKMAVSRHIINRAEGFKAYLEKMAPGKMKIRDISIDLLKTGEPDSTLAKLFSNSNIKGVLIPNSRSHLAAKFFQSEKGNRPVLIGYDLIQENIKYLKKGTIDFLISQKPEDQAYKAIKSLFDFILMGKKTDKTNFSPIDIIVKENIDYYKRLKNRNI